MNYLDRLARRGGERQGQWWWGRTTLALRVCVESSVRWARAESPEDNCIVSAYVPATTVAGPRQPRDYHGQ